MPEKKGPDQFGFRSPRFASSKFSPPSMATGMVHRSRLSDRLEGGRGARLTLVVGSAGAGKTVLLADWFAAQSGRPSAWLNCDSADVDPVRFVAGIIEAMRRACQSDIGADALQLLNVDGEVSADVVAALVDDLERPDGPELLAIDDLHLAGPAGAAALGLLLHYRALALQLVVASRVDPQLRLHRMRANRELVEVRDEELCFSAEETGLFFSGWGVRLSEPEVALVHRRSEGWIAGLQMAAISMRGSSDAPTGAALLQLRPHTVAGYFLDEVLYRQPLEVAGFMLGTSVLDELSAAACSALCGPGAGEFLERLYRDHLFLARVNDDLGTYRSHQLIREVLRAELHARDPERERRLHESAARYLAGDGQIGFAVRHLLVQGDIQ
jgi:LuxR family transcriptional regulator, maltose regulon positive regulatory protein